MNKTNLLKMQIMTDKYVFNTGRRHRTARMKEITKNDRS